MLDWKEGIMSKRTKAISFHPTPEQEVILKQMMLEKGTNSLTFGPGEFEFISSKSARNKEAYGFWVEVFNHDPAKEDKIINAFNEYKKEHFDGMTKMMCEGAGLEIVYEDEAGNLLSIDDFGLHRIKGIHGTHLIYGFQAQAWHTPFNMFSSIVAPVIASDICEANEGPLCVIISYSFEDGDYCLARMPQPEFCLPKKYENQLKKEEADIFLKFASEYTSLFGNENLFTYVMQKASWLEKYGFNICPDYFETVETET
jgi:hypothetical protein